MRNLKTTTTLNNHPIQESAPACAARSKSILKDSQTDSRNPFKKSSTLKQSSGGGAMIKQGLCFDSIAPPATSKPRISSGSQFGARNLNRDLQ